MIEEYGTNNIYAFHLHRGRGQARIVRTDQETLTVDDAETIEAQASAVDEVAKVAPNVGYSGDL